VVASIELDIVSREAALLRARGAPFFLATVVRVEGSSYRRPAARMLVAEHRWLTGCVSGGCLEGDVVRRVEFLTRRGPVVVRYDSTSDDDIGWGLGMGCNGVVEVLLERIDGTTLLDPTRFVEECIAGEGRGVLVTVFSSTDEAVAVGARICLRGEKIVGATVPEGRVREMLASRALAMLATPADWTHAHELRADGIAALVEPVAPVPHVFVVGSGHDAVPLVALVRAMGLRVTVADAHASVSLRERFTGADRLFVGPPQDLARVVDAHDTALVVLMTHDYQRDRSYLGSLLATRARYVGVLGPERRTARMLAELTRAGVAISDDALARLHAPVGLDLGAETPREIALSIVAEMQATLTSTSARRLRERPGAIHLARGSECEGAVAPTRRARRSRLRKKRSPPMSK
jgi:xanthine/CO dehydrogenase XdhC/CoxF family maturation factor